jgi:hypothetical protein
MESVVVMVVKLEWDRRNIQAFPNKNKKPSFCYLSQPSIDSKEDRKHDSAMIMIGRHRRQLQIFKEKKKWWNASHGAQNYQTYK